MMLPVRWIGRGVGASSSNESVRSQFIVISGIGF
jgi:hypothetical protein